MLTFLPKVNEGGTPLRLRISPVSVQRIAESFFPGASSSDTTRNGSITFSISAFANRPRAVNRPRF
jgi:hypothetical protein